MAANRVLLATVALATLSACPASQGDVHTPRGTASARVDDAPAEEAVPTGRLTSDVTPLRYALELRVDPKQQRFTGRARIDLRLASDRRSFWMHGRDLEVLQATFGRANAKAQAVTLTAPKGHTAIRVDVGGSVAAGDYTLTIDYSAPFASDLAGMYRLENDGQSYAFTQFEALDARRAFPCFDEPGFKTPFDVTLVVPEGNEAIANTMPVSEKKDADGWRRISFAKSEKLPTYLVAFAVGPFDIVTAAPIGANGPRERPIPLRGIAVKGKGDKLALALKETAGLVTDLETYFGIAYPFDKLDIIAVPDFAAGAMENAGAITFREALLLVDPKTSTEAQRRDVVGVAAHELAHQWFGNLVTMQWWDDVWLNEAFATWMGQRVIMKRYPTWAADLELMGWVQGAMDSDSLVSARKIVQPIASDDDVENAFDDLTYSKGGGLISMFERFLGEEKFREGVHRYLEKHRFGNAATSDFLNDVLPEAVRSSFRQYLERPGVPRVDLTVSCAAGKLSEISVQAERYLPLGSSGAKEMAFQLPLCVRTNEGTVCDLVTTAPGKKTPLKLDKAMSCPTFSFPNADGAGYVRYTPSSEQIKALFGKPFKALSSAERLAAVDALRASFRTGAADLAATMAALSSISADPDRTTAFAANDLLAFASDQLVGSAERAAFESFASGLFRTRWNAIGFAPKAKAEEADVRLLRRDLLESMALVARDRDVRKQALPLAKKILGLGGDGKLHLDAVPSEIVTTVLIVGVQDGGDEVWEAALAHLKQSEDAAVRRMLLSALVSADDAATATKARALTFDPALKASEVMRFVLKLSEVHEQTEATWAWFQQNLGKIVERVPESTRSYLLTVPAELCDGGREREVRDAVAPQLAKISGAALALENTVERMKICEAIKKRHRQGAAAFFKRK